MTDNFDLDILSKKLELSTNQTSKPFKDKK